MNIKIREEQPKDLTSISTITQAAFKDKWYSNGEESQVVARLREAGALTISLVAVCKAQVIGHVVLSPVTINGAHHDWFGLGPVSVKPDWQGLGIGSALIREGLERIEQWGANGCVVLGAHAYYSRFGFEHHPDLRYEEAPAEHFMVLSLGVRQPSGRVLFHEAFSVS